MKPDFENEAMMAIDWAKRDEMFLTRLTALEAAMDRQRHFMTAQRSIAMGVAMAMVIVTHASALSALPRLGIALGAWLVVRIIGRALIGSWSRHTMMQIERDYPRPPALVPGEW